MESDKEGNMKQLIEQLERRLGRSVQVNSMEDCMQTWKDYYRIWLFKDGDSHSAVNKIIREDMATMFDMDYDAVRRETGKTAYSMVNYYQSLFINSLYGQLVK